MLRRLHALLLLLAAWGLLGAGCGGDDATVETKGEAELECLEQAGRIDDPRARKVAAAACNGKADKTRDAAVEQCLETARGLPEGDERDKAEDACKAAQ